MAQSLSEIWAEFRAGLESRHRRLADELESAWKDLEPLLEKQKASWSLIESWSHEGNPLGSFEALFDQTARQILEEPATAYQRLRIAERVLEAIDDHRTGLEALLRRLPAVISISGRGLVETLQGEAGRPRLRPWLPWQKAPRALPLRALVQDRFIRQALELSHLQGSYLLLLARVGLDLNVPWQLLHRRALRTLSGGAPDLSTLHSLWDRWQRRVEQRAAGVERLLKDLRARLESGPSRTTAGILHRRRPRPPERSKSDAEAIQQRFAFWSRQQRAVHAFLRLELDLTEAARRASSVARQSLEAIEHERGNLFRELDSVIQWLEAWEHGKAQEGFPPPQAPLASAEERLADWTRTVALRVRSLLPHAVETVNPRAALPSQHSKWRRLEPQSALLASLEGHARLHFREGFQEAEASHREVVREIERARQVVAFGLDAARADGETGAQVARDAVANALSLLRYQREATKDVRPIVERSLCVGLSAAWQQCYLTLEQGRLGLWTHLAREGGRQAARLGWRYALDAGRKAFRSVSTVLLRLYRQFLVKIGWVRPPLPRQQHVIRRGYLSNSLKLDLSARDLPAIYRRLFRPEPVEDPRFLVGREAEMAALTELRQMWEAARPAAAIVVGERGSGKTSLLNCAQVAVFQGVDLIRGKFQSRVRTAAEMRGFLQNLFGLRDDAAFSHGLAGTRKVVVLEEMERSFLRQVDGYQGLKELLSLITATSERILWILVINRISFQFLDAAVGLGAFFSHRINTMSVEPEVLQNAILGRHNLSGLRLHYAPPSESEVRADALRRFLGLEQDPQQLFFEALYRESEGIFRSAFELWQSYIERVEGGVLYMQHPRQPDYEALISGLTVNDLFTLQAILQHGSLTPEEHAEIFQLAEAESGTQLEALQDR